MPHQILPSSSYPFVAEESFEKGVDFGPVRLTLGPFIGPLPDGPEVVPAGSRGVVTPINSPLGREVPYKKILKGFALTRDGDLVRRANEMQVPEFLRGRWFLENFYPSLGEYREFLRENWPGASKIAPVGLANVAQSSEDERLPTARGANRVDLDHLVEEEKIALMRNDSGFFSSVRLLLGYKAFVEDRVEVTHRTHMTTGVISNGDPGSGIGPKFNWNNLSNLDCRDHVARLVGTTTVARHFAPLLGAPRL